MFTLKKISPKNLSIQIDRKPLSMKKDVLILHVSPWYYASIFLENVRELPFKVQPSY